MSKRYTMVIQTTREVSNASYSITVSGRGNPPNSPLAHSVSASVGPRGHHYPLPQAGGRVADQPRRGRAVGEPGRPRFSRGLPGPHDGNPVRGPHGARTLLSGGTMNHLETQGT